MRVTRDRVRPGWLMPAELERERVEVRAAMARMRRAHARYRARLWLKGLPGRVWAAAARLTRRAGRP